MGIQGTSLQKLCSVQPTVCHAPTMSAMSLCSILGFPVIRGTTRANHGMSAPRKHDKERLCTLTSPVGAQGLLGFSLPPIDFVSDQSESGAFCYKSPPLCSRGELLSSAPPAQPVCDPSGVTGVVSQQAGFHLPHHTSLVIEPQRAPAREPDLDLSLQSPQAPSVTLGKSPVSL